MKKIFFVLLLAAWGLVHGAIPSSERAALIAFYNSTGGDFWGNNTGWKTPPLDADGFAMPGTENTWRGIGCDAGNTTVTSINLGLNGLNGSLPPELGDLTNLIAIDLNRNFLSSGGNIPPELGNLTSLETLILWDCNLTGTIPTELGNLSSLQTLNLFYNSLTGSIPTVLGNLSNLVVLNISDNNLTGTIPTELGNLSNLTELQLYRNQLSGTIPTELGNLSNLETLSLFLNQLSGTIPTVLGNLSKLKYLHLAQNQLTGTIPTVLGNLSELSDLYFHINQLSGTIPTALGNLSNLKNLSLHYNQLSGSIPTELGNLSMLEYLYLDGNQLSGSIPAELGNLSSLRRLNLSRNKIVGEIPTNLANLTSLVNTQSDFRYNGIYTGNGTLKSFLDLKQNGGDWESYQTIAPTGVSAGSPTYTSIRVSWTPIIYTAQTGGYRVLYSTAPGGPYTYFGITANKSVSQLDVTGLTPGTTYYFVVQTRTDPHANNGNIVDSEYSTEVSAATAALTLPTVTTAAVSNITATTADSGGNVTSDGGASVTARGVCWSTSPNPTTANSKTSNGTGTGIFTSSITGLNPNTTYHVRAYATNSVGTSYGSDVSFTTASAIPQLERNALIALYNGTNGAGWTNSSGWKTPPLHTDGFAMPGTENTWYGIVVVAYTVTEINLNVNNLSGTIPTELGNLSNLQKLYLDTNQLSGSIPAQLGNLSNLQWLYLYNNQLTGSIPAQLGNLSGLQRLYLDNNQLSGTIPTQLGNLTNLQTLSLTYNLLSGSIPTELGNLSNLQYLWLNKNKLSGSIPTSLTSLTGLINDNSDLKYNALYTGNTTLRTFLDSKQNGGDWESTQTIAPGGVTAGSPAYTSIRVSWPPIVYTGDPGGYRVYYSTTPGGPYTFFGITADKTVSQMDVTGLNSCATYYFVVQTRTNPHANNQNTVDSEYSAESTATTSCYPPTAATNAASGVGTTAATLNGTVNANNSSTTVTFQYGLSASYGSTVTATPSPVTGTTNTAVSSAISGLISNTTYHYRVVGQNAGGTANGADMTFITGAVAPTATTNAASGVGTTAATLNGTVNANNSSTTVTFQYGLSASYGSTVTATPSPVTGTTNTAVSSAISGLVPNTTYHYRVVGQNAGGTTNGADMTFITGAAAPTATTNAASGVGTTAAALNGTVNANNSSTTVTFQYGLSTSYGTTVTASPSPVSGTTNTAVSKAISGLIPNSTYHYRVVGQNAGGPVTGADMTFTTLDNPDITGTITEGGTGVAGVTLTFSDNAGTTTTGSDGSYSHTVTYGWSGTVTPSKEGYNFVPTRISYPDPVTTNQTNRNYTATAITPVISGKVTINGTGVSGVTLTFSNGAGTTTTAADGTYSHTVNYGWSGTVTPEKTGYEFTPSQQTYTGVKADQTNQDYQAGLLVFEISGKVSRVTDTGSSPLPGVTLTFQSGGGGTMETVSTDADGKYSHTVTYGWSGTVTPSRTGFTFSPESITYNPVDSDKPNQDYSAFPEVTQTYTISGAVTKADGSGGLKGVILVFSHDGGHAVTDANGEYSHTVNEGWAGRVSPSLSGYTFAPPYRLYTGVQGDLSSENYTANAVPLVISGRVLDSRGTGISGVTLTLSDSVSGESKEAYTDFNGNYRQEVDHGWWGTVTPTKEGYEFEPGERTYENLSADRLNQDYEGTVSAAYPVIYGRVFDLEGVGIAGVTITFSGDGGTSTASTDANGNYSHPVEPGWSGTAVPEKNGYTFEPADIRHDNVMSDLPGQDYTGTATYPVIAGMVKTPIGTGIPGVLLEFAGTAPGQTYTNDMGTYTQTVPPGWTGTVTPSKKGYEFEPSFLSYENVNADQLNQDYVTTTMLLFISGRVATPEGEGVADIVLIFSNGGGTAFTGENGDYVHEVDYGWSGTVTPASDRYTFAPPFIEFPRVDENQYDINFTAHEIPPVISGRVTRATPSGIFGLGGVILNFSGGVPIETDPEGYYSLQVPYKGWSGTVTPEKEGYVFFPTSQYYDNVTSDTPEQNFTAILSEFHLTLEVERLVGGTLIIRKHFAELRLSLDKTGAVPAASFVILRKEGGGSYEKIHTIPGSQLQLGDTATFTDTHLEGNKNYTYKVIIEDVSGNVLGASNEVEI